MRFDRTTYYRAGECPVMTADCIRDKRQSRIITRWRTTYGPRHASSKSCKTYHYQRAGSGITNRRHRADVPSDAGVTDDLIKVVRVYTITIDLLLTVNNINVFQHRPLISHSLNSFSGK